MRENRTSRNFRTGSQSNWYGGDAECPFVIQKDGLFYLSRTQLYGRNNLSTIYASANPLTFGVADDRFRIGTLQVAAPEIVLHQGQYYIAALKPGLDGIRIAKLRWTSKSELKPSNLRNRK